MIRIAILSVAHMHAYGYCRALRTIPGAEVAGVYDDELERATTFSDRTGVPLSTNLDNLLHQSDAVIICAENAKHLRYIEAAAAAGKPILCEKPLSNDVATGLRIVDVVRSSGVPFYLALPIRFVTAVQQARSVVRSGVIGRVLSMSGTNHGSVPGGWFLDRALSGGGAVADHVPHVVDIMRWILGQDVTDVYAEISSGDFTSVIDDTAIVTMTWSDGTFSTLDPSWSRIHGTYPEWGDVVIEVVGTKGVLSVNAYAQKIDRFSTDAPNHRYLSYGDDADLNMVHEYVSCVQSGCASETLAGLDDGLHALRVAAAAYASAESGSPAVIHPDL